MFIYVAAHNRYSIGAQIKGIWAIGPVSPHRPLGSRNKMSLRKSKTRLIPSPRHVGLRAAPAAGPAAVHQFAHGRYGDRPKGLSLIHISEPTRRTPISYAVFCLKKKKKKK